MKRHPENVRMEAFLAAAGITARVKYLATGSCKGTWRLYSPDRKWSIELAEQLNALGFLNLWGEPLGEFSGNGGYFSTLVRGHNELLAAPAEREG